MIFKIYSILSERSRSVSFIRHLVVFNVQPVRGILQISLKIHLNTYCTLFVLFDERRNYLFIEREYVVCDGQSNIQNAVGWGDRGGGGRVGSDFSETMQYKIT